MTDHCPRTEAISTYLDAQLDPGDAARLEAHVVSCVHCRTLLEAMRNLRADLGSLPEAPAGFDMAEVIRGRIAALPPRTADVRRPSRGPRWVRWFPAGIGAAVSLSLGLAIGLGMTAPVATVAPVAATLEVFAPIAPGGLCVGLRSCWRSEAPAGATLR